MTLDERRKLKSKNVINTIYPYRWKGTWFYDDEDLGVHKEAFVMGSSEVIDHLVGSETNSFTAHISSQPIPKATAHLVNVDHEQVKEGDTPIIQGWYRLEGTDMIHWLCGCVLDYFEGYPKDIYVKLENLKQ